MSYTFPIRLSRRRALGLGVAMAATLAVMQPPASSAQETVKLGALIPVTGGLQSYGEG